MRFDKFEARCRLNSNWKSSYAMLDWYHLHHHKRLKTYIEAMPRKLLCQECRGSGELWEDAIDHYNIYINCGWCEGIGYVTPWVRGFWLRYQRAA